MKNTTKLTIAIDAREAVGKRAGKGRYLVGMLRGFAEINDPNIHYLLYTREPLPDDVLVPKQSEVILLPPYRIPGFRPIWQALDMRRRGADVFIAPTGFLPVITSLTPTIVVIHDLAVWKMPGHQLWTSFNEKALIRLALARAAWVTAVSKHTARDLEELFGRPIDRTDIAYNATDSHYHVFQKDSKDDVSALERVKKNFNLPSRYILFVGTLEPRKNLIRLIEAYHDLGTDEKKRTPLLIVGKKGWQFEAIFARVTDLGEEDNIRFLGYVPDADLPALYSSATLAVYPSLYEGFGLPAIEALACGTPLVASNNSSIPEAVGDAGVLVSPVDIPGLTTAIRDTLRDEKLRERLAQAGPKQSARFSWRTTAEIYLNRAKTLSNRQSDR